MAGTGPFKCAGIGVQLCPEYAISVDGKSYRMKEAEERAANKRQKRKPPTKRKGPRDSAE
jgi:hypothetical protein